jgi:hypothetical protein
MSLREDYAEFLVVFLIWITCELIPLAAESPCPMSVETQRVDVDCGARRQPYSSPL